MTDAYTQKVVFLGDGAVGKTAIIQQYVFSLFKEEYKMTIGVEFHIKDVEIFTEKGMKRVRLQIWDFEGQERFRFLIPTYLLGANGVMLIFDLTRRVTFEQLPNWMSLIRKRLDSSVPILLMGNKVDLKDKREIKREEAIEFAKKANLSSYAETSAKININILASFETLAKQMIE
jgi:small GTP-binding protein